jgi:outer membrane protein assembly factor BamB/lysophospholipase L1-like esterase
VNKKTIAATAVLLAVSCLAGSRVLAANGCEAARLKAAGAYWSCRLGVAATAAKTHGLALDYQRCDAKFAAKWARADRAGGRGCGTGSESAIQAFVVRCGDGVVTALAGGPLPVVAAARSRRVAPRARRPVSGRCESGKLRVAGQYSACRARADASTHGAGAACDAGFAAGWSRLEANAVDGCPSTGDAAAIQALVADSVDGLAAALAGSALPSCALGSDWPELNRDPQNSRAAATETQISPDDVGRLAPRWNVGGLSAVTGTPAVVDGVVYFGDWSGVLHARRADDGTELWSHAFGSAIRPAPLVTADRVYAPESNGLLHAVRRDTGDEVWSVPLDTQPLLSIDSSPILAGDTIVIGVASFEQVVKKPDYSFRGNVVGLDAGTGQVRWRVYMTENDATAGAGVSVWSSAAVDYARKLVFVGTGQTYEQPASPRGDSVIAIRYETGDVAWTHQFTAGDVFTVGGGGPGPDADVGASPNLFTVDGHDVVGVGQKNGVYHVLDRTTGALVWERQLTNGSPLGGIMVTAAVHDGVVYVNSNKWKVFGIFSGTNSPLDTSATFALDARDGTILWQRDMPAPMFGAMTYADGVVYQGTIDGTVHALSARDGTELWSDAPGGGVAGGFSVVDGTLYVGHGFWFFAPPATPDGGFTAYAVPPDHWVGTWSASPLCFEAATLLGLPASTQFDDQTLRMIVHTSLGGDTVRVRLTNGCGVAPLAIGAASLGIRDTAASIRADTSRPLTFGGQPSVSIPAGATATSDPVALTLPDLSDLAITLYLPASTPPDTSHPQAATGYLSGTGDFTADVDGTAFPTVVRQWFFLDSVDVLVRNDAASIVAFGDSIIDGAGSTYDANTRWPDVLARRLVAARAPFGVLNQGINGNKVLNTLLGDSALSRFDRDVLGQAAVKYVVLLEGVNDIGLGHPDVTADDVIAGYRTLAARAHDAGLKIFGGTLTPAKDNVYPFYAPYDESKRQAINQFIREGSAFDAFIDFDAAVRDPADPAHWKPGYSVDGLHPDDAGAAAMGDAVDLSLFH